MSEKQKSLEEYRAISMEARLALADIDTSGYGAEPASIRARVADYLSALADFAGVYQQDHVARIDQDPVLKDSAASFFVQAGVHGSARFSEIAIKLQDAPESLDAFSKGVLMRVLQQDQQYLADQGKSTTELEGFIAGLKLVPTELPLAA